MPATHLINVDLPAPLSPTSAITSPARTSKSTPRSACTEPKLLLTAFSSRFAGAGVADIRGFVSRPGRYERAPAVMKRVLVAVLRVDPGADLALLQEPFREEELVVLLGDPHRSEQDRRRAAGLAVHALDLLVLDDRDGRGRCGVGLLAHGLVDRSGLPAGEDELHVRGRRVLAGQRDRLQAVGLQRRNHRAGETVVGRD